MVALGEESLLGNYLITSARGHQVDLEPSRKGVFKLWGNTAWEIWEKSKEKIDFEIQLKQETEIDALIDSLAKKGESKISHVPLSAALLSDVLAQLGILPRITRTTISKKLNSMSGIVNGKQIESHFVLTQQKGTLYVFLKTFSPTYYLKTEHPLYSLLGLCQGASWKYHKEAKTVVGIHIRYDKTYEAVLLREPLDGYAEKKYEDLWQYWRYREIPASIDPVPKIKAGVKRNAYKVKNKIKQALKSRRANRT